jgi:hypothetical protein
VRELRLEVGAEILTVVALALATDGALAQEGIVQMRETDVQRGTVAAQPIGAATSSPLLEIGSAALAVRLPSGEPYTGYLITAHQPASRLFWWTLQGAGPGDPENRIENPPAHLTFFASETEILGVELGRAPPSLWILRSATRVDSFDEGLRQAMAEVAAAARSIEQGTARWMRTVSLARVLPSDFYYQPGDAMPALEMRVTAIARRPGGWMVTLAGREGRAARVLLDDLFVLESAEESPAGPGR